MVGTAACGTKRPFLSLSLSEWINIELCFGDKAQTNKSMKKKPGIDGGQQLEILKAVAQAWHSHSDSPLPTTEFEANRRSFIGKPTRFKLEAMKKTQTHDGAAAKWDFRQSLWDSYEIVRVFSRLEAGLVPDDDPFDDLQTSRLLRHRWRGRRSSLRYLFDQSSRRFNEIQVRRKTAG